MRKRHLRIAVLAAPLALLAVAACGPRQAVPRDPADVPGYLNAPPSLDQCDPSALRDRRILIDPGHGGHFRGAVGDDGLTEAEVNLGVALYLQGMLQWAGAEVHLTRTTDRDFLSSADSSLTRDLAARVAMCDSLQPDVFLSIHHNSTARRDPDINETQTYYPLGREGADLDLARAIHRRLVLALEIEPAKILPGGFHVLRHSPVPAVLGEPAMLSNPVMEGRLSLARSLELEAGAYFLGLRDYFAGGMPRWKTDLPDTVSGPPDARLLAWTFDPGSVGAPTLDPTSVAVLADGDPIPHDLSADGQIVLVSPHRLDGVRWIEIRGRNLAGRAAPRRRHERTDTAPTATPPAIRRRMGGPTPPASTGDALTMAPAVPVWLETDGRVPIVLSDDDDALLRNPAEPTPTPTWHPLLPALIGKRVALDPRGGGTDHQGLGPLGARGSELNLQVAERLAALLRGAGCDVVLVRGSDLFLPDPERVRRADAHDADLYLAVGRSDAPEVRYHHGSIVGTPWAASCAGAIQPLLADTVAVTPAWDYILRHTACPAVMVNLEIPTTIAAETRLTQPAWQDATARALFRATVSLLQPDAPFAHVPDLLDALGDRAWPPARLDLVRLDGNFSWLPPSGQVGTSPLPSWGADDPGLPVLGDRHVIELRAGPHWQLWSLERTPTGDWHGHILLENR